MSVLQKLIWRKSAKSGAFAALYITTIAKLQASTKTVIHPRKHPYKTGHLTYYCEIKVKGHNKPLVCTQIDVESSMIYVCKPVTT